MSDYVLAGGSDWPSEGRPHVWSLRCRLFGHKDGPMMPANAFLGPSTTCERCLRIMEYGPPSRDGFGYYQSLLNAARKEAEEAHKIATQGEP